MALWYVAGTVNIFSQKTHTWYVLEREREREREREGGKEGGREGGRERFARLRWPSVKICGRYDVQMRVVDR